MNFGTPPRPCNELFVILLPTLECNLRCSYCFEEHPPGRWTVQQTRFVLEAVFDLLAREGAGACRLHWQGGEPLLMGRDYWGSTLESAVQLARSADIRLTQSMQTNLLLYGPDVRDLAREYLDGTLGTSFEVSTRRRFPGGTGADFRSEWLRSFGRATADGLEVGVLCLLDEEAVRLGARRYLRTLREEYGITGVRFALPFRRADGMAGGYWLDPVDAGRFLAEAYETWTEAGGDDWMTIRPFRHLTDRFRGESPGETGLCVFARNCGDIALSVSTPGDVTLCDSFTGSADRTYGNLFEEPLTDIFDGAVRGDTRQAVADLLEPECTECRYLGWCFGGCLARSVTAGSGAPPRDHYCETYRTLFRAIETVVSG